MLAFSLLYRPRILLLWALTLRKQHGLTIAFLSFSKPSSSCYKQSFGSLSDGGGHGRQYLICGVYEGVVSTVQIYCLASQ
ncbi:hypothetical protein KP509_01G055400 [Ceratopteris richardii]|uniref:Secreted protein n=1 Tax=Ceratopteris richardii TaxID=49495 RepID=A0A8T2VD65_CERRI|nr:hypothetical protein KP509_01G055400 [Ceratopteris richardii]